jgi:hypothetical protein
MFDYHFIMLFSLDLSSKTTLRFLTTTFLLNVFDLILKFVTLVDQMLYM